MRRSAAARLNVKTAETCGLSDFRCSAVVGARHVVPKSDSLLRFWRTAVSDGCYLHSEKNASQQWSWIALTDERGQRRLTGSN